MSKSEKKGETAESLSDDEPQVRISDRRHWVRKDWDKQERSKTRYPSVVEKLQDRVVAEQKQVSQIREAARQVREESESFRNRLERDVDRKVDNARAQFICDMLEVMDNLDRSVDIAQKSAEKNAQLESLSEGLNMVRTLFLEKFARQGVEKIDVFDKPFDPETAEALDVIPTDDPDKENTVAEVFQEGYRLGERTIRAARVRVAKHQAKKSDEEVPAVAAKEEQPNPQEAEENEKETFQEDPSETL